jgi:membrane protein implicated in regulation of membrane protease activity
VVGRGGPNRVALLYIFFGVCIAAVIVSLATSFSFLLGWQGSLVFFALLTGILVYIFIRGKREAEKVSPTELTEEDPSDS